MHCLVLSQYVQHLARVPGISLQSEKPRARNVYWMTNIVLDEELPVSRDFVMAKLAGAGIETRPFFYPMHMLPMYQDLARGQSYPVADHLAAQGINLPSSATLSKEDVAFVCDQVIRILETSRSNR